MTDVTALVARLDALEIRVAYQDETIEDLNKIVTEQWAHIDRLNRHATALVDRLQDLEHTRSLGGSQLEPPPPHY